MPNINHCKGIKSQTSLEFSVKKELEKGVSKDDCIAQIMEKEGYIDSPLYSTSKHRRRRMRLMYITRIVNMVYGHV